MHNVQASQPDICCLTIVFSTEDNLGNEKQEHINTIAMIKKGQTKYAYYDEKLNVKEICSHNKKRREHFQMFVLVDMEKDVEIIPAKYLYVRNKSRGNDWLVLVSTGTHLSREECIRIYGKLWNIMLISA